MPESPCCANLKVLRISAPGRGRRFDVAGDAVEIRFAVAAVQFGLGSNRSIWLGPPFMNR